MLGLLRLMAMLLVALTIVYWALILFFGAGERARLAAEWERDRPPLPRHTYVRNGIREYRRGLRRRLLWWVYLVPIAAVCLLIYLLNFA